MEESAPPPQLPPAGWYEDPDGTGQQRYWDGSKWTDQLAPPPPQPEQQLVGGRLKDPRNDGHAAAGYVCAILLPIVGIIIAIVLYNRNDTRGTPVLLTSVVIGFVSVIILASAGSA